VYTVLETKVHRDMEQMFTDWVVLKTNLTQKQMIKVPEYIPAVMKNIGFVITMIAKNLGPV